MSKWSDYSDEKLREIAIPDVYQKTIYDIKYKRLANHGIRLISFDIDDTVTATEDPISPVFKTRKGKKIRKLFRRLNKMGFKVVLLTNAKKWKKKRMAKRLGVKLIANAKKPKKSGFKKAQKMFGVAPHEMAHVGNSLRHDVVGANRAGVTSCLVRNIGLFGGGKSGIEGKNRKIRKELSRRGMWVKHHQHKKGDQYYQLHKPTRKVQEYTN